MSDLWIWAAIWIICVPINYWLARHWHRMRMSTPWTVSERREAMIPTFAGPLGFLVVVILWAVTGKSNDTPAKW